MLTAIAGINWGDEGKGRMVDLFAQNYDIVVRYQGGNNAGHTVVNHQGKFILNLLPSGILNPKVVNVMGNGMVIDLEHLCNEIKKLRDAGISITPENLKISHRAMICLPYHQQQDVLEEERLGAANYGSTRRGIAPAYGDKYLKKGLPLYYLLTPQSLDERLKSIVAWKDLNLQGVYGSPALDLAAIKTWVTTFGSFVKPFICDVGQYLDQQVNEGKKIMFEAQLGALRDIDFGIYPFTSSSSTIAAYAPIGAGIPNHRISETIGIMKAYSSCVGEGPFTCELQGEAAKVLREAGGEYGAATGRPRRVGPFDAVASKYGVKVQGADVLALTKLDVLSGYDQLQVCTAYEIDGSVTTDFPVGEALENAKPIYQNIPGWQCDIAHCRKMTDLPEAARNYIDFLEKLVGCPIKYISVGPEREQYIIRDSSDL